MQELSEKKKHLKRNLMIYQWYQDLRITGMRRPDCIDVVFTSKYNNHDILGWNLSWNQINHIIADRGERE